ncbi:MAG: D-sedoheptulose 7-phosphate isomerase [Paludibacter sp.]|nr:D-sedoheptulose 7-phosphate isomerase [Paludibacter sp.]
MNNLIKKQIQSSINVKELIINNQILLNTIESAANMIISAYEEKKKTLLAGNGGSAADAQHIAGEFVSRFYFDRPGLPSLALTTDTSILTAIGNDYGYEKLFARQIQAQGNVGDVFIGISTSGNSLNVIEALKACKEIGVKTIGFTGDTGGEMADLCDICIKVPSDETPRIQECHILIGHILCFLVEDKIFNHLKPEV